MAANSIDKVASLAIQANDVFNKCHEQSVTSVGVTANTVVIDCALSQRRLALITIDECPGMVGAAIGTKGRDQSAMINQFPIDTLTTSAISEIMEQHFARSPE